MTVEVNVNAAEVAAKVSAQIQAVLVEKMESWKNEIGMLQMVMQDAADQLAVAELIENQQWDKISDRLRKMDTAPREHLLDMIDSADCLLLNKIGY